MPARDILIVPTGTANIASVTAAFSRAGRAPAHAANANEVDEASQSCCRAWAPSVPRSAACAPPASMRHSRAASPPIGRRSASASATSSCSRQQREPRESRARHRPGRDRPVRPGGAGAAVRLEPGAVTGEARVLSERLCLFRQQLSGDGGAGVERRARPSMAAASSPASSAANRRLPVPPRAVRRLRRDLLSRFLSSSHADRAHHSLSRRQPTGASSRACASRACAMPGTRRSGRPSTRTRVPTRSSSSTSRRRPRAGAPARDGAPGARACCRSRSPSAAACATEETPGAARGRRGQGRGQHRRGRAAGAARRDRRALRRAVLRRSRSTPRGAARRRRSRSWSRAAGSAPACDAIEWAREARAARRRRDPAHHPGTGTARAPATTSR